ncbi:MAG: alpha-hydroxy acid oxidase [Candidatus Nanopelagicales bacterium]
MTKRRFPRPSEIIPLIGFSMPSFKRNEARLAKTADLQDIRKLALRRTPRAVFDYTDGAAGSESSLNRAREVFDSVEFSPRVLRDVTNIDTSIDLLGKPNSLPFAFAPTGFTRMMNYQGEIAVAKVAEKYGLAYGLSTLGTTSPEDLAQAVPRARLWFQLYMRRDTKLNEELVARVKKMGYETIILTVDTVVGGSRFRDVRNGLTIPPKLSGKTLLDMARHPHWWMNLLTTSPLEFASLKNSGGTVQELINKIFDPSINLKDIEWLRKNWDGKILVKGVQSVDDAKMLMKTGIDGIILSTHGGRQLDKAPVPLELLPEVKKAVGKKLKVFLDGGVMSGSDILAAIGFGADAVFVGRAYLYGIMAGGQKGVERVVEILKKEIETNMRLMGITSLAELTPDRVRLR